jgi:hypothetical protein
MIIKYFCYKLRLCLAAINKEEYNKNKRLKKIIKTFLIKVKFFIKTLNFDYEFHLILLNHPSFLKYFKKQLLFSLPNIC